MSGKLDQSLDEITTAQRRTAPGGRRRSVRRAAVKATANMAPSGGVRKATKPTRGVPTKVAAVLKRSAPTGDSKIIVSNLPKDVTEKQIKEYFVQSVGPIKRVEISYGPNSQSRGIANITFVKTDGANTAFTKLNGLLVDNRPIKIEIIVGTAQAAKAVPGNKTLAERTTQPKGKPKSAAAAAKPKTAAAKADTTKGAANKKGRGARNVRPAKKTAEELDSDMADYFTPAGNDNANGAAPVPVIPVVTAVTAVTGDAGAEDEIM